MTGEHGSSRQSWRYATLLALAALLCGLLLGGLSAWFLGSVAVAGLTAAALTFNFHIPAALVRLFATGRTAARYGERLLGHKAALSDQVERRVRLFSAMAAAPSVRQAGWQLGDQARLADYLDDVEDLDFARLRAGMPALTLACGIVGCLAATAFVAPLALAPIALFLAAILMAARWTAKAGATIWARARASRRGAARALGTAMASAVPLQAEGLWNQQCGAALAGFSAADRDVLGLRRAQAAFDAAASLLGPICALCVIAVAWLSGARGEALLIPVFLAFAWLPLGEAMGSASRILVAQLRRRAAQAELDRWTGGSPDAQQPRGDRRLTRSVATLAHTALQRRAPGGQPMGAPAGLTLKAGRPTILSGESGVGKTSLLKQVAGWIGNDMMRTDADLLGAEDRRALSTFCPHDAAILHDTVRTNLFAPAATDEELWRALQAVELEARIKAAGGLDAWITQDSLSLGEAQRLNLARAWLSDRPIVLLDEPAEHLDHAQGQRILARLAERLRDRIVVLSSHRATTLPDAVTIALGS